MSTPIDAIEEEKVSMVIDPTPHPVIEQKPEPLHIDIKNLTFQYSGREVQKSSITIISCLTHALNLNCSLF